MSVVCWWMIKAKSFTLSLLFWFAPLFTMCTLGFVVQDLSPLWCHKGISSLTGLDRQCQPSDCTITWTCLLDCFLSPSMQIKGNKKCILQFSHLAKTTAFLLGAANRGLSTLFCDALDILLGCFHIRKDTRIRHQRWGNRHVVGSLNTLRSRLERGFRENKRGGE